MSIIKDVKEKHEKDNLKKDNLKKDNLKGEKQKKRKNKRNYTHVILFNKTSPKLNIPKENIIGLAQEP
jgi:hypothetical protein